MNNSLNGRELLLWNCLILTLAISGSARGQKEQVYDMEVRSHAGGAIGAPRIVGARKSDNLHNQHSLDGDVECSTVSRLVTELTDLPTTNATAPAAAGHPAHAAGNPVKTQRALVTTTKTAAQRSSQRLDLRSALDYLYRNKSLTAYSNVQIGCFPYRYLIPNLSTGVQVFNDQAQIAPQNPIDPTTSVPEAVTRSKSDLLDADKAFDSASPNTSYELSFTSEKPLEIMGKRLTSTELKKKTSSETLKELGMRGPVPTAGQSRLQELQMRLVVSKSSTQTPRYRALMPDAGVGAVMGYVDRLTYGTVFDERGKTLVSLSRIDHVSVNPAFMVDFACHCNLRGIVPMVQMAAATSKELPAIMLGGGLRLFRLGRGDIAIGGGLLLGWYKDLRKLKVGGPVTGTAEIDADLAYITIPKPASYVALRYQF